MAFSNKKSPMLIITAIVLILIISVVFFIKSKQGSVDKPLLDFVPKNTSLYFELNLDNNHLKVEPEIKDFLFENNFPESIWNERSRVQKLGLVLVQAKKQNEFEKAWLVRGPKVRELEVLNLNNYYLSVLANDTAVLSLSLEAMRAVRDNISINELQAQQHILPNKNYLCYGFIQNSWLRDWLYKKFDQYKLVAEYFKLQNNNISYWQASIEEDNLIFNFNIPANTKIKNQEPDQAGKKSLSIQNNAIVFNNLKLKELVEILKIKIEEDRQGGWPMLEKYLLEKYEVDINELYTFFDQSGVLVIQPKNIIDSWDVFLDYRNYNYAFILNKEVKTGEQETFTSSLEKFIQNYLAFKYPLVKKKILPDKTTGLELVAESSKFISTTNSNGDQVKIIKQQDFEFSYSNQDELVIFSNSENLIGKILSSIKNQIAKSGRTLIIDPVIFDNKFLNLLNQIDLDSELEDGQLVIKGQAQAVDNFN